MLRSESQIHSNVKTLVEFMFYFEQKIRGLRERILSRDPSLKDLFISNEILAVDEMDVVKLVSAVNSAVSPSTDNDSALTLLIKDGQAKFVNFLLDNALVDPNEPDRDSTPPIVLAVWRLDTEILQILCSRSGVDVNGRTPDGKTALMHACIYGKESHVDILLQSNEIDVSKRTTVTQYDFYARCENPENEWSAADYAAWKRHPNILKLLAKKREIVINPSYFIMKNVILIPTQVQPLFLTPEMDVNAQDEMGFTLLMKLVLMRRPSTSIGTIQWLMRNPSLDINVKNKQGKTAFQIAVESHDYDVACLLLEHPKINHLFKDNDGKTELMHSVGSPELTKILLVLPGIDVTVKDAKGKTVWAYSYHDETTRHLEEANIKQFYESALKTDADHLRALLEKHGTHQLITPARVIQYILKLVDCTQEKAEKLSILKNSIHKSNKPHALSKFLLNLHDTTSAFTRFFIMPSENDPKQIFDKIREIEPQIRSVSLNSSAF